MVDTTESMPFNNRQAYLAYLCVKPWFHAAQQPHQAILAWIYNKHHSTHHIFTDKFKDLSMFSFSFHDEEFIYMSSFTNSFRCFFIRFHMFLETLQSSFYKHNIYTHIKTHRVRLKTSAFYCPKSLKSSFELIRMNEFRKHRQKIIILQALSELVCQF